MPETEGEAQQQFISECIKDYHKESNSQVSW